jgi:hypothetical protein
VTTTHAQSWNVRVVVEGPDEFTVSVERNGQAVLGSPLRGSAATGFEAVVRWLSDAEDAEFEVVVQREGGAFATLITPRRNVALYFIATTLEQSV